MEPESSPGIRRLPGRTIRCPCGGSGPGGTRSDRLVKRNAKRCRTTPVLLLAGHSVNNMLLYGAAGTGKSATVKSLLKVPEFSDLRIIEIDKQELSDIPALLRRLAGRRQKFILFIDDLSFENADVGYSVLKTVLEGSIEKRLPMWLFTPSNRRHLMRETFSERGGRRSEYPRIHRRAYRPVRAFRYPGAVPGPEQGSVSGNGAPAGEEAGLDDSAPEALDKMALRWGAGARQPYTPQRPAVHQISQRTLRFRRQKIQKGPPVEYRGAFVELTNEI